MTRVLLALGANLGDRENTLDQCLAELAGLPQTQLLARSGWYSTTPVGGPAGQSGFLNGAVLLSTALAAQTLANELRRIETHLGRERHVRWDARRIDIDLLLYEEKILETPDLEIPHPRMVCRRFVLDPACEIAGEMIHPLSGWTLAALRSHWQNLPRTVSVCSKDSELAAWLARELSQQARDQSISPTIELVSSDQQPAMRILVGEQAYARGPFVRITATDSAVILHEALAAIAAAWPA